jgi:dimethylglycine dehydrogenase
MLIGDFTVARLGAERFFLIGSGIAENYHMRWFERHLPASGVTLRAYGGDLVGLAIAGPLSRELLSRLTTQDVSNEKFPFLAMREMDVGGVPARVGRISFTGDLGYEIWVKPDYERALYDRIVAAGAEFGLTHFGARALHAMRLEKGYGTWAREYRPIYTAREAGLDRFVSPGERKFIGCEAALADREHGGTYRLVSFAIDAGDADAFGDEPVWHEDDVVGWVTSGGYGYSVSTSLAMGYVKNEVAAASDGFAIEILGERRPARRLVTPLFDPQGARLRG